MLARESNRLLGYQVLVIILLLYAGLHWHSVWLLGLFWLSLGFFLFTLYFFRDPERQTPSDPDAIVAPADGKIIKIEAVTNESIGEGILISTFMSPFNVHVNRIPFTGEVEQINYRPGRFWSAFKDEALLENEQNSIIVSSRKGRLMFTQVAGAFARRIVCRLQIGQQVTKGERFGMIMFGSRVDLIVPRRTSLTVAIGQKVRAGETIIGILP